VTNYTCTECNWPYSPTPATCSYTLPLILSSSLTVPLLLSLFIYLFVFFSSSFHIWENECYTYLFESGLFHLIWLSQVLPIFREMTLHSSLQITNSTLCVCLDLLICWQAPILIPCLGHHKHEYEDICKICWFWSFGLYTQEWHTIGPYGISTFRFLGNLHSDSCSFWTKLHSQ
jgi:hypothetical protein